MGFTGPVIESANSFVESVAIERIGDGIVISTRPRRSIGHGIVLAIMVLTLLVVVPLGLANLSWNALQWPFIWAAIAVFALAIGALIVRLVWTVAGREAWRIDSREIVYQRHPGFGLMFAKHRRVLRSGPHALYPFEPAKLLSTRPYIPVLKMALHDGKRRTLGWGHLCETMRHVSSKRWCRWGSAPGPGECRGGYRRMPCTFKLTPRRSRRAAASR